MRPHIDQCKSRKTLIFRNQQRSSWAAARTRSLGLELLESRDLLTVVQLNPIADNTLYEDAAGNLSNGIGSFFFAGQAASQAGVRRGLLKFDIASAVPAGAHINSATLQLHLSQTISGDVPFELHRVLADWGEGMSDAPGQEGSGTTATANSATWLHRFFASTFWATAGGDFSTTASATATVGSNFVNYFWSGSQMASDVQGWLDTPSTQFGWLLKEVNESLEGTAKRFDSRESSTPTFRPVLTIDYSANVNQAPTLTAIASPPAILENAGAQIVNLTGISAGPGESQSLTVSATSSNPGLISDPQVTYASPNATGSLSYSPTIHQFGTAVITVTVQDDGGTADGGVDTINRTFTVSVTPVNDAPTLSAISNPLAILEDAGQQLLNLAGITAGPGESQNLTVTAISSNPSLIPNPSVTYTSPSSTGSLSYKPIADQSGSAVITVTVKDDGGTNNGGVDSTTRTFTVAVTAVNDHPTLDAIPNPAAVPENAGLQSLDLTGISAGPGESQSLTVTAVSSNPALIPNPAVAYNSPNATGLLTYTPATDHSGSATITVTVKDDGGTAGGGVDTFTRTVTVTVSAAGANAAPTLSAIANPPAILEDAGQQIVNLAGITAGPGELQSLTVTALSSNPSLIPNPIVTYTSPDATGSLTYTPAHNQSGSATITVTVKDDGGTSNGGFDTVSRTFTIAVTPVNDPPSFLKGPDKSVNDDSGPQGFAGWATAISRGPPDEAAQSLTFSITNVSNPSILSGPVTIDASGRLQFTPRPNTEGSALVTVQLKDGGGVANSGNDTSPSQTFTINVAKPHRWHDGVPPYAPINRGGMEVDDDGSITPTDVLLIINYLNAGLPTKIQPTEPIANGTTHPFYDVDADDNVTATDALLIINLLNAQLGGPVNPPGGEGEGGASPPMPADAFFHELGNQSANQPLSVNRQLADLMVAITADDMELARTKRQL